MPDISVVTADSNAERTIARATQTARGQHEAGVELLVAGNASRPAQPGVPDAAGEPAARSRSAADFGPWEPGPVLQATYDTKPAPRAHARAYRPDIDGLRAIAVLAVLLFHCGVPGFPGGFVGVDLFFVISGFLITGQLAGDIEAGQMSIGRFYDRRIRRIGPALFVTLIVTAVASAALLLPSYLVAMSWALVSAATSVANIYLWRVAGDYFAPMSTFQPLLHTWSLSVEEQFYLFVPVLMMVCARPLRRRWVLLFGPLCLGSFAFSLVITGPWVAANFYLLPSRAWEFGIGALVATTPLPAITRRWAAEAMAVAALALLLLPVFLFDDETVFPGLNALWPCLGAALLIHVGGGARPAVTALLGTRPFVAVGLISYSLYLVHWPIISLMRYRAVAPLDGAQIAGVVVASVVLATLMWRYIEQPFRRPAAALTRRRVFAGGLGAIAVACLLGLVGIAGRGFPARFPGFAEQQAADLELWKSGRCFLPGDVEELDWSARDCTRIATGPRKVMLWGDSYAAHYVPGIIANADALHATVLQYTASGCPPALSLHARPRCEKFNAHALDIIRTEHVQTVILSARWTDHLHSSLGQIGSTLAALDAMGVSVVLVGQSPEFAADAQVVAFLKGSRDPGAVNRWTVAFPLAINDTLRRIAGEHAFVDPMPALCDGSTCTYQDRGTFLFLDYGHYSVAGSALAVRALFAGSALGASSRIASRGALSPTDVLHEPSRVKAGDRGNDRALVVTGDATQP
jgi:peptidoglycan/LPS O-acetylase OafA/YrhL